MTRIVEHHVQGFELIGLQTDTVELAVIPELGAKIVNLRNRLSGREWMWRPPGPLKLFRSGLGDGFAEGTKVGADECVPTIAACRWRSRNLPDHGEAWTQSWTLDQKALSQGVLRTILQLPVSPLLLERSIELTGSTIRLDYCLTNTGDDVFEYLWGFHPLMTIESDDELMLSAAETPVTTDSSVNCGLGDRGTRFDWPTPRPGIRLDRLEFGVESAAVKFYTEPGSVSRATNRNGRTGDFITFLWDIAELNTLGVWLNRGGWGGYHHVAIEPTNGAPDPLDVAVRHWRRFSVLAPGESRRWNVGISVGMEDSR